MPIGWSCRIHRLLLCSGVRPPHPNECPTYHTKQYDGEVPVMLDLWGMRSLPLLPSLLGPLCLGVVSLDRVLSMGHIFLFHHTTCGSTCDTLSSSVANQGDNTVSVAQGGTATPGATKQLLPPDRVFKRNIYLYVHQIN